MRKTVLLILLLLILRLKGSSFLLQAEEIKTLEIGATAPAFPLPGVDGKTYILDSFRESKILVIIFTANHSPTAQAYNEFYPLNIQPWEPNITTLMNFDSLFTGVEQTGICSFLNECHSFFVTCSVVNIHNAKYCGEKCDRSNCWSHDFKYWLKTLFAPLDYGSRKPVIKKMTNN